MQDNNVLLEIMKVLEEKGVKIFDIYLTQAKIELILDGLESNAIEELHRKLIK